MLFTHIVNNFLANSFEARKTGVVKYKQPLSLRLEPEVHARLEECAKRTKLKKYALALMAIEAAVEAVERNNYKLVVPIEFEVTHEAVPKKPTRGLYPPHKPQGAELNEKKPK